MSVFAIGDIHGSYVALKTLLEKLTRKGKERSFVFLGDYVNKGTQSKDVIDLLIRFSQDHDCVFLKGNHDILMLNARNSKADYDDWVQLGGGATLESYKAKGKNWEAKVPSEHWEFLENTQSYYKYENKIFVHAGLEGSLRLKNQHDKVLFWNKNHVPK